MRYFYQLRHYEERLKLAKRILKSNFETLAKPGLFEKAELGINLLIRFKNNHKFCKTL